MALIRKQLTAGNDKKNIKKMGEKPVHRSKTRSMEETKGVSNESSTSSNESSSDLSSSGSSNIKRADIEENVQYDKETGNAY